MLAPPLPLDIPNKITDLLWNVHRCEVRSNRSPLTAWRGSIAPVVSLPDVPAQTRADWAAQSARSIPIWSWTATCSFLLCTRGISVVCPLTCPKEIGSAPVPRPPDGTDVRMRDVGHRALSCQAELSKRTPYYTPHTFSVILSPHTEPVLLTQRKLRPEATWAALVQHSIALNPPRHRHGSNAATFAVQIDDHPTLITLLDIGDTRVRDLGSAKTTAGQHGDDRAVLPTLYTISVR